MATSPRPRTPRYNDPLDIRLPPPSPRPKTEIVERVPICGFRKCQNKVEQYCPDCNKKFCAICMPKKHERDIEDGSDDPPHTSVMPYPEYANVMKSVEGAIDYKPSEEETKKAMEEDIFVMFDQDAALRPGPAFHRLHSNIDQHLHIVSVIGSSGAGKSSFIKGFVRPEATSFPIPAPSRSGSFTRDLLAYEGVDHSVVIDSEGSKGSAEAIIGANEGNAKRLAVDASKKVDCVSIAYPRLLYTFSTVLCYVSNQQKAVREHAQELLFDATQASASIVNPHKYRVLMIVFNKVPLNECIWDVEEATSDWKEKAGDNVSELLNLFTEIRVVYIPAVNSSKKYSEAAQHFHSQRERCYDEIKKYLKSARKSDASQLSMIGRKEQFRLISAAIKRLSVNPREGLDLSELFWDQHQGVPDSLHDQVLHYFHSVMKLKMAHDSNPVLAWRFAHQMVHQRLVDIAYTQYYEYSSETPSISETIISKPLSDVLQRISIRIRELAPCSASFDFKERSEGRIGLVYCQERTPHNVHKSTKYWTEAVPGIFKRSVIMPCSWDGKIELLPDKVALEENLKNRLADLRQNPSVLTTENGSTRIFKPYAAMLKASFKALRELHGEYLPPHPFEFCIACFQYSPSLSRDCGHNFCARCLDRIPDECLVCGDTRKYKACFVPPLAGTRILSLDGGGVRGVVSLCILKKLQELCYGMPIAKLFDLVAGTSTGGIIALALVCKRRTVSEIRDVYMKLSAAIFEKKFANNFRVLFSSYYPADTLEGELQKEFDTDKTAFGSSPHLVVPASKVVTKQFKVQLLTSYLPATPKFALETEPMEGEQQPEDSKRLTHFKLWEIARATSAAPTYFPPFLTDSGDTYLDGGLVANCPASVALDEAAFLWPTSSVDYLAGVGTGFCENHSPWTNTHYLVDFLKRSSATMTDPEVYWKQALNHKRAPSEFMVRLNPKLRTECELDDHAKMHALEMETEYIFSKIENDWSQLQNLADKAIASLFYITQITMETNDKMLHIKGIITSRTEIPLELYALSLENSFASSVVVNSSAQLIWKTVLQSNPGDPIPRIEFHLSLPPLCSQFGIVCKLKSKDSRMGSVDHMISGSPFEISHDSGSPTIRNRLPK